MLVAPPTSVWRRSASSCVPASSPQSQWLLALTAAQAPRLSSRALMMRAAEEARAAPAPQKRAYLRSYMVRPACCTN